MSDNYNKLLENCMPSEYQELKSSRIYKNETSKKKEIENKKYTLLQNAVKERVKYIKYWFATPHSHSISHITALIRTLTQLSDKHRDRVIEILYTNIMIFIDNDIWFQSFFSNLNDISSYKEYVNWKANGCKINLDTACFNFEEISALYTQSIYQLSEEATIRIKNALDTFDKDIPSLKTKLELLNISKSTYNSKIICGGINSRISRKLLLSISIATGNSPDYLLDLSDQTNTYLTNTLPSSSLDYGNCYCDSIAQKKIAAKLMDLNSTNREKYNTLQKKYNYSDELLKQVKDEKKTYIPSSLINELGRLYNCHPFYLTNLIKRHEPYEIETCSSSREKSTFTTPMTRRTYIKKYLSASDAFNILDNAQPQSQIAYLRDSLFLLFVYFDTNTQNNILDNFAVIVSNIYSTINIR